MSVVCETGWLFCKRVVRTWQSKMMSKMAAVFFPLHYIICIASVIGSFRNQDQTIILYSTVRACAMCAFMGSNLALHKSGFNKEDP